MENFIFEIQTQRTSAKLCFIFMFCGMHASRRAQSLWMLSARSFGSHLRMTFFFCFLILFFLLYFLSPPFIFSFFPFCFGTLFSRVPLIGCTPFHGVASDFLGPRNASRNSGDETLPAGSFARSASAHMYSLWKLLASVS